jgi:hypothetical protein
MVDVDTRFHNFMTQSVCVQIRDSIPLRFSVLSPFFLIRCSLSTTLRAQQASVSLYSRTKLPP